MYPTSRHGVSRVASAFIEEADISSTASYQKVLTTKARSDACSAQRQQQKWDIGWHWKQWTSSDRRIVAIKVLEEPTAINFCDGKVSWANVRGNSWAHRFGYTPPNLTMDICNLLTFSIVEESGNSVALFVRLSCPVTQSI